MGVVHFEVASELLLEALRLPADLSVVGASLTHHGVMLSVASDLFPPREHQITPLAIIDAETGVITWKWPPLEIEMQVKTKNARGS